MAPKITSPSVPLKVTSPTMPNSVGWRRCSGEATMPTIRIATREPRPNTTAPTPTPARTSLPYRTLDKVLPAGRSGSTLISPPFVRSALGSIYLAAHPSGGHMLTRLFSAGRLKQGGRDAHEDRAMRLGSFIHGWRRSIAATMGAGAVLSLTVAWPAPPAHAAGTSMVWVARYGGHRLERARAVAASPDGARVYVTGISPRARTGEDAATVAYDAATGMRLWVSRYAGPGDDGGWAIAVSPDGARVYITGFTLGATGRDYLTVAYDAATGSQVWVSTYHRPPEGSFGNAVAVSPDGTRVYVTGESPGSGTNTDYATIAYEAATGDQVWARRYNGPGNLSDDANAIAVSPDGGSVFVTGVSYAAGTDTDYATIAYDAATGAKAWLRRYNGPGNSEDTASSVAVSPDGTRVYVTGGSAGLGGISDYDYATLAYDAASGAKIWGRRYQGPGNSGDYARALALSPDGTRIYVTGISPGVGTDADYATLAYDAASGAKIWARRYNGPGNFSDAARAIGVSQDGTRVYV